MKWEHWHYLICRSNEWKPSWAFLVTFCRSFYLTVCKFFIFPSSSQEPSTKLGTEYPWVKETQAYTNERQTLYHVEIVSKYYIKNYLHYQDLNPLLQNQHMVKSHLSVDWMVTEWWLNGGWMANEWWRERWFSVAFQSPFNHHSLDKWQAHCRDLSGNLFFELRNVRIKGKVC